MWEYAVLEEIQAGNIEVGTYLTTSQNNNPMFKYFNKLNELGSNGWEVVGFGCFYDSENGVSKLIWTLKHPKEEKNKKDEVQVSEQEHHSDNDLNALLMLIK